MIEVKVWSHITRMDGTNERVKEIAYINPKYVVRIYVMGDCFRVASVDGQVLDCDEESASLIIDALSARKD